ncbi:MAG: hypothetical protein EOP06_04115 [Proteobacteria bacterium]|nr:MAG: hypothetical protein EOP06_04115 [Pseudomonadota bacterium]
MKNFIPIVVLILVFVGAESFAQSPSSSRLEAIDKMLHDGDIDAGEANHMRANEAALEKSLKVLSQLEGSDLAKKTVLSAQSKSQFCHDQKDPSTARALLFDSDNFLDFSSKGGIDLGKGPIGLCWWHSEFTRNAAMLAYFEPTDVDGHPISKPTAIEAKLIAESIMAGKEVVRVPGYKNLREFSRDFEAILRRVIAKAQVGSILKLRFFDGLTGSSTLPADKLREIMLGIQKKLEVEPGILYSMLQSPGLAAHSLLFIGSESFSDGIDFFVVDSLLKSPRRLSYKFGDERFGAGVPYLKHNNLNKKREIAERFCR